MRVQSWMSTTLEWTLVCAMGASGFSSALVAAGGNQTAPKTGKSAPKSPSEQSTQAVQPQEVNQQLEAIRSDLQRLAESTGSLAQGQAKLAKENLEQQLNDLQKKLQELSKQVNGNTQEAAKSAGDQAKQAIKDLGKSIELLGKQVQAIPSE